MDERLVHIVGFHPREGMYLVFEKDETRSTALTAHVPSARPQGDNALKGSVATAPMSAPESVLTVVTALVS